MARTDPTRSVVIHGHFYQPPREDPWLEMIEAQPSAFPSHDWNERVERECYRAVVAARVPGREGRIHTLENALHHISFDFGPTLLEWMEGNASRTYEAILEADQISRNLLDGHGNAIAQAYHHTILPLASRREKVTEVRWGIADFRRRFGREPRGMWLPETAVDSETLEVLVAEGIAFTIVAPHQVTPLPRGGLPALYRTSRGRSIALFVYNGPLSHGVAFGPLLRDAERWATSVLEEQDAPEGFARGAGRPPRLVSIATDGETYGHHHRFGEMALAAVLRRLRATRGIRVENFSSFLSRNPPEQEVRLVEPSSWSCPHGVDRWQTECGCRMAPSKPTQQRWRFPLREAMEELAKELHEVFMDEAPALLGDPWEARDDYGAVVAEGPEAVASYVRLRAPRVLDRLEEIRAAELLEMERNALRLFTSCGWFFDDLAGIEPLQILRYAARAIDLAGSRGIPMKREFLHRLAEARSNEDPPRDGRILYLEEVETTLPVPLLVGAGAAALLFLQDENSLQLRAERSAAPPGFLTALEGFGRLRVTHRRTGRDWLWGFEVLRQGPGSIRVRIWPAGREEDSVTFLPADLPEGYRIPLQIILRDEILAALAPTLLDLARAGDDGGLTGILTRKLLSAVEALASDPSASRPSLEEANEASTRVQDLARLHTLLGLPIPFDAQTEFHRIFQASAPERRDRLGALLEPLGFVPPQ